MSEWYHPMHLDDIAVVEHQRGTQGKFRCCLADFSARPYWSGRHLAPSLCFTHTHAQKLLARRPSPCYDLWKVLGPLYIFHKGILLHPHGLWGTVHLWFSPQAAENKVQDVALEQKSNCCFLR